MKKGKEERGCSYIIISGKDGDDDADDDDFQGVGKVVTRSAAMKAKAGTKQKKK